MRAFTHCLALRPISVCNQDVASEESFTSGYKLGIASSIQGSVTELYLDLHGAGGQGRDLFLHAVSNARVHGGTPREDVVSIEVLPDINITLHDAVVRGLMDASRLHPWKRDTGCCPWVIKKTQADTEDNMSNWMILHWTTAWQAHCTISGLKDP